MTSGRKVAGDSGSLVNTRDLQLECARMVREGLPVPVLLYGSETMIWREKEWSRIRAVQMDNLRGLLVIRRMDRVLNVRTRELWGVVKGVDEQIDERVLRWFDHIEKIDNDKIARRMYVGNVWVVT